MQANEAAGIEFVERASSGQPKATIVVLHGYGADMNDLFPIADYIDPKQEYRFLFLNGLYEPREMAITGGKAWFPIDTEIMMQTMTTGGGLNFRDHRPEGLEMVASRIKEFLDEEVSGGYFLAGFSQGSMVALQLQIQFALKPKGLVLLSSTIYQNAVEALENDEQKLEGLPIFESHGEDDALLPFAAAEDLAHLLEQAGADLQFESFPGGHEVPPSILEELRLFLERNSINVH